MTWRSLLAAIALTGVTVEQGQAQCCCGGMRGMPPQLSMQLLLQQQLLQQQLLQQQLMRYQLMLQQQTSMQQSLPKSSSPSTNLQLAIQQLAGQSESGVRAALQSSDDSVRLGAAWLAGQRGLPLQDELIGLLTDQNDLIRQTARKSLVKLSQSVQKSQAARAGRRYYTPRSIDFGPAANATTAAQNRAAEKWRAWFEKNS